MWHSGIVGRFKPFHIPTKQKSPPRIFCRDAETNLPWAAVKDGIGAFNTRD
jgi:hypothetical protein